MTWSRCPDCDGTGRIHVHRMAVVCGPWPLEDALLDPDRIGHGCQSSPCETCKGEAHLPGLVPPL